MPRLRQWESESSVPAFCNFGSRPMCSCLNRISRPWPHGPLRMLVPGNRIILQDPSPFHDMLDTSLTSGAAHTAPSRMDLTVPPMEALTGIYSHRRSNQKTFSAILDASGVFGSLSLIPWLRDFRPFCERSASWSSIHRAGNSSKPDLLCPLRDLSLLILRNPLASPQA